MTTVTSTMPLENVHVRGNGNYLVEIPGMIVVRNENRLRSKHPSIILNLNNVPLTLCMILLIYLSGFIVFKQKSINFILNVSSIFAFH